MGSDTTQPSLLSRVRNAEDHSAWREFDEKYRELIFRYCQAKGLQAADAEDVRQITLTNLAKSLRGFQYDSAKGRFRSYLGRAVNSSISRHFRRPDVSAGALDSAVLATIKADDDVDPDAVWTEEWVRHHYRLAMAHVRTTFDARSIDMFDRLLAGESVEAVAQDFDTSQQAVHKVKQRIRNRLKERIARQVMEEDRPDG